MQDRNGEQGGADPSRIADMFARGGRSVPGAEGEPVDDRGEPVGAAASGADAADAMSADSPDFSESESVEDGVSPEDVALSETAAPLPPAAVDFPGLAEITEISRLKYRYLRTLDTKSWDDFTDTMLPEATATYSEYLQFESRDAFVAFLRNTLGPHVITDHRCDHPEIDVMGDEATGTWYLSDTVLIPEHNLLMRGAAYYTDRYVRCDDGKWRISHTGYERTYEVVVSLSDLPSLRLTSDRWGLIAREDGVSSIQRNPRTTPAYRASGTA